MPTDPRLRIAAFDVDGTLTRRDCVVPFLRRFTDRHTIGRSVRSLPGLVRPAWNRDRDVIREIGTRAVFEGREDAVVRARGAEFAEHIASAWLRDDTLDELRSHQDRGDTTVMVSASYECYLDPLAQHLGVDAVLSTRLVVIDGICTGALDGPNCRGPEKVRRLHRWIGSQGLRRDEVEVTAYGDSPGDRELLADADIAHWRGPNGEAP